MNELHQAHCIQRKKRMATELATKVKYCRTCHGGGISLVLAWLMTGWGRKAKVSWSLNHGLLQCNNHKMEYSNFPLWWRPPPPQAVWVRFGLFRCWGPQMFPVSWPPTGFILVKSSPTWPLLLQWKAQHQSESIDVKFACFMKKETGE